MSEQKGFVKAVTLADGSQVKQFLTEEEFKIEMMQINGRIDPGLQARAAEYFKEIKASDEFVRRLSETKTPAERDAIDAEILKLAEQRIFDEFKDALPTENSQPAAPAVAKHSAESMPKEQQRALLYQCYLVAQARLRLCKPTIHEVAELDSDDLADMLAEFELLPYDVWHERRFGVKPE